MTLSNPPERSPLPAARAQLVEIVKRYGHLELDEPLRLASGDRSRHFVDGKRALARGEHLRLAIEALMEVVTAEGHVFDAVGGLTMGADHLAHALVILRPEVEWFSIRKEAKGRGTRRRIEGAELHGARRVLLVEDVVTRGGSIAEAYEVVRQTEALVVCALTLVDRGGGGGEFFERKGVPYHPLLTHEDLGIPAIGSEPGAATTGG